MAKYKSKELSLQDKIGLAAVTVLGRSVAKDAYLMAHPDTNCTEKSFGVSLSRWLNDEQAKDFMSMVRKGNALVITSTDDAMNGIIAEGEELTDGQLTSLISKGIISEQDPKRKSDMALKLMQWRKDAKAEQPEKERRRYILTYRSICRTCKLMAMAMEVTGAKFSTPADMITSSRKAQTAARHRRLSGEYQSGDDKNTEAISHILLDLGITATDCYDMLDFLRRVNEGRSKNVPAWMKK